MRRKSSSRAALRGVRSASTACFVLALGAVGSVAAQESTNEVAQLPPVVVTGRAESGPTVTVEAGRIEQAQAADLKDVLQALPSVAVGGGQTAAQKIYVRGFEDKLLNVSIDGATQAGYLSHHQGQFLVVPELLKEVRVSAARARPRKARARWAARSGWSTRARTISSVRASGGAHSPRAATRARAMASSRPSRATAGPWTAWACWLPSPISTSRTTRTATGTWWTTPPTPR